MAARKKPTGIEWVGGLVSMPAYVTGEGEPYRPESLFWMGADGVVIGYTVGMPGELVALAAESLRNTIERPMFGKPHAPERVRVASAELANALRAGCVGIEIVCAPTPELDTMLREMRERMDEDVEQEQTYLSPEIGSEAVGAFFRAAAALFRKQPWKIVPSDQCLLSVTIEDLGVHDAALSVIGQLGQSLGVVLFADPDDFDAYLEAADAMEHGAEPMLPPHFTLNFERGADLATTLRKEIIRHGWEVAQANAYPWLVAVDEDCVARPPTAAEVTSAEAIALALTRLLSQRKAVLAAWKSGETLERTLMVSTQAGELAVTLRVPYEPEAARFRPPYDVVLGLTELAEDGDEMDHEMRAELEHELMRRFVVTQLGATLPDVQYCEMTMDLAATCFGATIATLTPARLREIVFEIIPNMVSVDASAATWIIYQNRALYVFLKQEFGLKQADACLRVLAHSSVKKLERALSDMSKFSVEKSLSMEGRAAGFDMDSEAGVEAYLHALQSQSPPQARKAARKRGKKKR